MTGLCIGSELDTSIGVQPCSQPTADFRRSTNNFVCHWCGQRWTPMGVKWLADLQRTRETRFLPGYHRHHVGMQEGESKCLRVRGRPSTSNDPATTKTLRYATRCRSEVSDASGTSSA